MHPLLNDLQDESDADLQKKLSDLTTKWHQTNNVALKNQIQIIIDDIQYTLAARIAKRQIEPDKELKELDNLINFN